MKPDTLLERIGQVFAAHEVGYAVSHEAAAQRYAPFLSSISQVRCRMLIGSAADAAIGALGARVVNEGANLAIIEARSLGELLFREQVGGIWLASPIQVLSRSAAGRRPRQGNGRTPAQRKDRFLMVKPEPSTATATSTRSTANASW